MGDGESVSGKSCAKRFAHANSSFNKRTLAACPRNIDRHDFGQFNQGIGSRGDNSLPIANCFLKRDVRIANVQTVVNVLSSELNIPETDITINFIKTDLQIGQAYDLMIFLYLPSVWSKVDIGCIELTFVRTLSKLLGLSVDRVFSIVTIIESGHVVSDGHIEEW